MLLYRFQNCFWLMIRYAPLIVPDLHLVLMLNLYPMGFWQDDRS